MSVTATSRRGPHKESNPATTATAKAECLIYDNLEGRYRTLFFETEQILDVLIKLCVGSFVVIDVVDRFIHAFGFFFHFLPLIQNQIQRQHRKTVAKPRRNGRDVVIPTVQS